MRGLFQIRLASLQGKEIPCLFAKQGNTAASLNHAWPHCKEGIATDVTQNERIRICSILMEFSEASDCTDEFRKDEAFLKFKMKKHVSKLEKISHAYIII